MGASEIERKVAMDVESTLAGGISDFDSLSANGAYLTVTEIDVSGLQQAVTPNKNAKERAFATRADILALKSESAFTFSRYMHGGQANAAEDAQGALEPDQDTLFKNALGGLARGYAAGVAGGTASAPDVETGEGSNYNAYDWVFGYDTSEGTGRFRRIKSIATDTLTMDDGHDLHFTPDGGGADVLHAVVWYYLDRDALIDRSDGNHTTLTFYALGDASDDTFEPKGCKITISIGAIEQGVPTEYTCSVKAVTFDNENESAPTLATAGTGVHGEVVGSGTTTIFEMADHDAALADVEIWTVEPTIGVDHNKEMGPNGTEGVHGYTATGFDETTATVTLPYSDDYAAEFRAETRKHLLIQVGTGKLNSWFIYFPNLAYMANPNRAGHQADLTGSTLEFKAMENDQSTSGLSADEIESMKSKIIIGRVA